MSETKSKKRKKFGDGKVNRHQPRRGGPGVLLTCETGRESKCRREGLDILSHYYYSQDTQRQEAKPQETNEKNAIEKKNEAKKCMSLDEEIAMLHGGATTDQVLSLQAGASSTGNNKERKKSSPFAVYDTGCRGSVFFMCTLPHCSILGETKSENVAADSEEGEAAVSEKRQRVENQGDSTEADGDKGEEEASTSGESAERKWDPLSTVARVVKDLETNNIGAGAPSSRFVTRMIPIQVTCFASLEEIRKTARILIEQKLLSIASDSTTVHSFAVSVKRRHCSNITTKQVIDTIVEIIIASETSSSSAWKVDLDEPEFTINVEICQTLCGMAVIPNYKSFRNFNLVQIRESVLTGTETQ